MYVVATHLYVSVYMICLVCIIGTVCLPPRKASVLPQYIMASICPPKLPLALHRFSPLFNAGITRH